jgi:N-acetylglutamate synthase-like GNAT family acetyltransferase
MRMRMMKASTMDIRKLGPNDGAALEAAVRAFGGFERRPAPSFLADARNFAYVGFDGETVVAFAWGGTLTNPEGGEMLVLAGLHVAEAVRMKKAGKELVDAFVGEGRAAGLTRMWMLTDAGHRAAKLLYEGAPDPGDAKVDTPWWVLG